MTALRWLLDRWYVPVFLLGAVLAWAMSRGKDRAPALALTKELDAIRAGASTRKLVAELGAANARMAIEQAYSVDLRCLEDAQKVRAAELSHDPVALAKFLVRVSR